MEAFMSDDINNLDPNDEGLKSIFGARFHDVASEPPVKVAQKPASKPMDAQWEPVRPEPNWMDALKGCVKWVGLFGTLSCLIFYWQQAGLMAESIAVPSMCVCTALAGLGVGKNVRGDTR
jgi:hypothetical protein